MVFPSEIGRHRVSRHSDVLHLQFVGPLTFDDIKSLRELMHLVRGEHGRCYMLADATALDGIAAEARKALSAWARADPDDRISGVGVHGINFAMRALSVLTLGAVKLLTRRPVHVHFAHDEADARAWIVQRRAFDLGASRGG